MNDAETQRIKESALATAYGFVKPITEDHPPEAYKVITAAGGPLSVAPSTQVTPAEQVLGMVFEVANWLLGEDEDD